MDFRTLINKLDSFNTEAKKEPERMKFSDAINHVKDITFTPPTPAQNEYSIANNVAFKGKDLTDPKVRLALYQDELKRSPGRLLGEIAQRIKPSSDAQIELSMFIGELSEKEKGTLSKEEQTLAFEVIKHAIRSMDIERDADQSTYKDSDAPDASEMESTTEDEMARGMGALDKFRELYRKGIGSDDAEFVLRELIEEINDDALFADEFPKLKAFTSASEFDDSEIVTAKDVPGNSADEKIESLIKAIGDDSWVDDFAQHLMKKNSMDESTNESDFDRDSVTYDEVLPFVKMTYKTLLTDLQTARQDIENYKAGGDDGEEGGDIAMIMPYLRDLKDMQKYVKAILDNPDMDIETVVDHMMPAGLDTSASEDLVGRFKKSFAKDPQLAKRLFKDPQLDFYSEDVEATEWFKGQTDVSFNGDEFYEAFGWIEENDENVVEAEYQGRTVKLNKPMRGDVKKFKVYVKNPKGNVVKVNFGDPDMRIKKSNPARRRSFRARHNCDNPGPKTKARYWSCRKW